MKRFIALILTCVMALGTVVIADAQSEKNTLEIGDKVIIGSYKGEPVEYTVWGKKDADGNGTEELFLASSKIISYKEYAPDSIGWYTDWSETRKDVHPPIRQWLNSTETSISYTTATSGTAYPAPSYASQPGFMSTMTDVELEAIVTATIRSNMYVTAGTAADGGSADYTYHGHWANFGETAYDAYINGHHVITKDKIFIPSLGDLYEFAGDDWDKFMNVGATDIAEAEAEALSDASLINQSKTWFRDTRASISGQNVAACAALSWYSYDNVNATMRVISSNKLGVRPCMYINADTEVIKVSGMHDVYRINGDEAVTKKNLAVGDVINIGTYAGQPVEYKVMGTKDVDNDGKGEFYLASTNIIAFLRLHNYGDAAGTNWTGINATVTSNLRTWLNSKDTAVTYPSTAAAHTPPYKNYAGFMSGMTEDEYNAIVPVTNKTLVPTSSAAGYAGGTVAPVQSYTAWPTSYTAQTSYSDVYCAESEDRVFIPSIEELYTFFGTTADALKANMNVPILGDLTTEYNSNKNSSSSPAYSWHSSRYSTWLRDNIDASSDNKRVSVYIYDSSTPTISAANAKDARGVRPCMYLDDDVEIVQVNGEWQIKPEGFKLTKNTDGANISFTASYYNDTASAIDYTLYVAVYNSNGSKKELAGVYIYDAYAPAGYGFDFDTDVITLGEGEALKAFLWDAKTLTPIQVIE